MPEPVPITRRVAPEARPPQDRLPQIWPDPPDATERRQLLDPARSFLVQAPAGSGKTELLIRRFLRLLAQADEPDEIVAITFTNAAAAEMRGRVLAALEKAEDTGEDSAGDSDAESLAGLAARAMKQANRRGWRILDLPGQLRITTIDAFCRSLALQCPLSWGLLSGLGGRLDPVNDPRYLYRSAATRTIELLKSTDSPARRSVEALLLWRDNNWKDVEDLVVRMLGERNRWYQDFVFDQEIDWAALRKKLEAPFCHAASMRLERLASLLDLGSAARERVHELAQYACCNPGRSSPISLAERADLPARLIREAVMKEIHLLEDAVDAYRDVANFLLTQSNTWRSTKGLSVNNGFPPGAEGKAAKARFGELIDDLKKIEGLEAALADFQEPMPVRYTEEEWELIRHCFSVLRAAFAQLQVMFAETGTVDFTEVAQIALRILSPENGYPSDFAIRQADSIRHLLVDEFQDTSRNQHQLLSRLIAAWPEREGRTCFCVGDPMQSIYSFREAEVELFERIRTHGLEIAPELYAPDLDTAPFQFEFLALRANFRTVPTLVEDLNVHFAQIFERGQGQEDGGVQFYPAEAARSSPGSVKAELHLDFTRRGKANDGESNAGDPETTRQEQLTKIVTLVQSRLETADKIQRSGAGTEKYRIAVLARTKKSLIWIAEALRKAGVGFRAIDLVPLRERPEVLDVLSLARALMNPADRTAWLGVLRAPWCGLSLQELHLLTSADDAEVCATSVPKLLESRLPQLAEAGFIDSRAYAAASRVSKVLGKAVDTRASAAGFLPGTWLESIWKALGGSDTVDAEQRENLRLLWAALDELPEGEFDLVGPGLDAALNELCAAPDPAASSEFGVQLMTIHKSKGLEFEVVIVPDLETEANKSDRLLVSWLERAVPRSDDATEAGGEIDQLTEFLIAPIQAKGEDASNAKKWVDGVRRDRDKQELRRVLYVAATRAREELHFFARPKFAESRKSGGPALCTPTGLLATSWPAFGGMVEAQFSAWAEQLGTAEAHQSSTEMQLLAALAAEAPANPLLGYPGGNMILNAEPPAPEVRPTILRRLPQDYVAPEFLGWDVLVSGRKPTGSVSPDDSQVADQALYARSEGQLRSRLEGTIIHLLLERLSHLRQTTEPREAALALEDSLPEIVAAIRSYGLAPKAAAQLANEVLALVQEASVDPVGAWLLSPHPNAGAESRWTGLVQGRHWNLRPDRIFLLPAGVVPGQSPLATANDGGTEGSVWWIIDYKTAHAQGTDLRDLAKKEAFLSSHRARHLGQLAAYAQVLRSLHSTGGSDAATVSSPITVRAGLYYPRLRLFDFWDA